MEVELISIGDEILRGMTVNTNGAFLSRELTDRGYSVSRHTVLPDDRETIQKGLREGMGRSAFVIATGGLGPTIDDLTREAARDLFSKEPRPLKNSLGTALGVWGDNLFLLPGVPREMERMFSEQVLPLLEQHFVVKHPIVTCRTTLCLLREAEVDPFLRTLKTPGVEIGIYPSYGSLQVVFRSQHPVDPLLEKLKERFSTFFVGNQKIAEAVHRELIDRKMSLALAESCTGGAIAARLTQIPDASHFFLGSIVAYSNGWKERFLTVRHDTLARSGAVSRETVEEMIQGLFAETDADFAIATSGVLGPKGGTSKHPVGTVFIAIGKRGEPTDIGRLQAPLDRAAGIEFAVQKALGALWRRIVHNTATFS